MQAKGVGTNQRTQVRGFANQRLRKIDTPLDPSNRRISIIVHYIIKNSDEEDAKPVPAGAQGSHPVPPQASPTKSFSLLSLPLVKTLQFPSL
jgi:chemotaxis protein MotB